MASPMPEVIPEADEPGPRPTSEASSEGRAPTLVDLSEQPAPASLPLATPRPAPVVMASPMPEVIPEADEPGPRPTSEASSEARAPAVAGVAAQPAAASLPPAAPQPSAVGHKRIGFHPARSSPTLGVPVSHLRFATRAAAKMVARTEPGLSVTSDARKTSHFGRTAIVGRGVIGKGGRWKAISKGEAGPISSRSKSGQRSGREIETGKGIGISARSVASLKGPEAVQWRLSLKRRCPSILETSAEYDEEVVWLCRVSASLK
jgi:hypothetical protein